VRVRDALEDVVLYAALGTLALGVAVYFGARAIAEFVSSIFESEPIVPPSDGSPLKLALQCPVCRLDHVDAPSPEDGWTNPPHKIHLCAGCGHLWRPFPFPTEGIGYFNP